MGFANVRTCVDRQLAGASVITGWRKQPSVVTAAGYWMDLSMSPGNPKPNYYASTPLIGARMAQSTDGGIFHGAPVAPSILSLRRLMALTATAGAVPLPMVLCDYLLYYPFIDEGTVGEEQAMDVAVTPATLSRYVDGVGVQMMAVVVAGHVGSPVTTFTVRYTNSDGVAGRVSQEVRLSPAQFVNGTVATSAPAALRCLGPWIPLQLGDTGVRSVQGVTMVTGGDVGLFTIVLVKPIANIAIRGIDAACEIDYLIDRPSMPRVVDDAYLNFVVGCAGSLSGAQILGTAEFVWS